MNDSPLTPYGPSQPKKTALSDDFAAHMKSIQERVRDWPPIRIAAVPAEYGHDDQGNPVVAKFVARAYWPDGLPMYATVDRRVADQMLEDGDLDSKWRLHSPGGEYVVIDRSALGSIRRAPPHFSGFVGGHFGDGNRLTLVNGNIADLRSSNLRPLNYVNGKWERQPPLHWQDTPLDDATLKRMKAEQEALRGISQRKVKQQPYISGRHADGSEITLRFVTCKVEYRHPEMGDWRYVIMDRAVGERFASKHNPNDPWGWSLAFNKQNAEPSGLLIQRTNAPQLARVVYGLLHPDKPLPSRLVITAGNKNPLDMREGNLIPKRNVHKPKSK
jgi:hypothetical protein